MKKGLAQDYLIYFLIGLAILVVAFLIITGLKGTLPNYLDKITNLGRP